MIRVNPFDLYLPAFYPKPKKARLAREISLRLRAYFDQAQYKPALKDKKGLLAMTYSPRGSPPKYHRRC